MVYKQMEEEALQDTDAQEASCAAAEDAELLRMAAALPPMQLQQSIEGVFQSAVTSLVHSGGGSAVYTGTGGSASRRPSKLYPSSRVSVQRARRVLAFTCCGAIPHAGDGRVRRVDLEGGNIQWATDTGSGGVLSLALLAPQPAGCDQQHQAQPVRHTLSMPCKSVLQHTWTRLLSGTLCILPQVVTLFRAARSCWWLGAWMAAWQSYLQAMAHCWPRHR